jgi:serine phosphatase RsbU (regulator of sigma subunit)
LGYKKSDLNFTFTNHTVSIKDSMSCHLSTDGFWEQLGGAKHFPFGNKRFKKLLLENCHHTFDKQSAQLLQAFNEYKGNNDKQDDVTVIGFGF